MRDGRVRSDEPCSTDRLRGRGTGQTRGRTEGRPTRLTHVLRHSQDRLRAIRRNILRSFLTMLGIIVGISAPSSSASAWAPAPKPRSTSRSPQHGQQPADPSHSPAICPRRRARRLRHAPTLTAARLRGHPHAKSPGMAGVSPEVRTNAQVTAGNQNTSGQVDGRQRGITRTSAPGSSVKGARISPMPTFAIANKVCLIGKPPLQDALRRGRRSRRSGHPHQERPVHHRRLARRQRRQRFRSDQDDIILIPYTSAMKRLSGDTKFRAFQRPGRKPRGDSATSPTAITASCAAAPDHRRTRRTISPSAPSRR
jgi:putative ABC transport system permease protein